LFPFYISFRLPGVNASDADFASLGLPLTDPFNSQIIRVHFAGEFSSVKYRGKLSCCDNN
jgi:hypothetical protein